jgi:hypothetical protein
MTVEIELSGGPVDGMRVAVPGDPMDPPAIYEMRQAPRQFAAAPRRLVYRRHVNPADTGALWLYRYEEQP